MARRAFAFSLESDDLTRDQAAHVEDIAREFVNAMAEKYVRGQREHGGNLYDKSINFLLDAAIEESLDQVTYLLSLRRAVRLRVGFDVADRDHNP